MHDHIPIRQFRASLSEVLRRVQQREERIAITRHNVISVLFYAALFITFLIAFFVDWNVFVFLFIL